MSLSTPAYDDVLNAARCLQGVVHRTPVLASSSLNERLGVQVFFKCENFQRIGAFKFRGGYNALVNLSEEQRKAGVIAFSSGNHAQAVALAARMLGVSATIVMPYDAPAAKKAATLGYGARVIEYNRFEQDREQVAREFMQRDGLSLIPPFDHPHVIAGQGTAAKELFEETGDLDALFVPLGGGGLLSGTLLSAHALSPDCQVFGVEPLAGNDGQQSLRSGSIVRIDPPASIADGALTQALGSITFSIIQRHARDILTADDDALCSAMHFLAERMKMVVEPTGCLGLAALLADAGQWRGKRVGVLLSGGNIDLKAFGDLVSRAG
jgi:threonine dehydratase